MKQHANSSQGISETHFTRSGGSPPRLRNPQSPAAVSTPAISSSVAPIPAFLHDIQTTAKLMSTTTFAIRELCRAGKLRFVRVGHRWLISTEAIQKFIHDAERA